MNDTKLLRLYRQMYLIRSFEQRLLALFAEGKLSGTTHTYQGEEAIAVAALDHLRENDGVFSNHRCHGHYIAYGGDVEKLLSEIMGSCEGVCGGRGGSQHLCWKNFYTNGIQGGMLPCAAGYAYAAKLRGEDDMAVAFIGDGTLGEGIVYETLNMASIKEIPLLVVVEDNGYAQTTPKKANCAGQISDRFTAFDINTLEIESNDVIELYDVFTRAFDYVRKNRKPCCCVVHTYRLGPHSKGDDFRDPMEIAAWHKKDPLKLCAAKLKIENITAAEAEVDAFLDECITQAGKAGIEGLDTIEKGISTFYTNGSCADENSIDRSNCKYFEALNRTLDCIMADDREAVVIGEDILDPYGGAFKVTKGLSTKYPERVIATPISEAGFAGIANGMSLNHARPIVEIMFADFSTLILDQVLNHGAKFKWMYNDQVNVPVIFRLPTGGKRGYGATHSQSPEKIFFGLPNVTVIAPSHYHDPGKILRDVYKNADSPVIFVENKELYTERLVPAVGGKAGNFYYTATDRMLPTIRLAADKEPAKYTLICYGGGLKTALRIAWDMMIEQEINVEVICPSLISPVPYDDIANLISDTSQKILILDESFSHFGWSSEIALAILQSDQASGRSRTVIPIGSRNTYISACKAMEMQTLVNADQVKAELMKEAY